ncbi:hypothetical protein GH714_011321 [Hevea brasiliensis]|uniref:Uncharacterized protein n=1 Tax=Hevea brasiliensis TaxID=3981 RepID=A0A6A6NGJ7_HEVBR|nr:hypothetical protein GH714_011321 [Hevea brasiliensis]
MEIQAWEQKILLGISEILDRGLKRQEEEMEQKLGKLEKLIEEKIYKEHITDEGELHGTSEKSSEEQDAPNKHDRDSEEQNDEDADDGQPGSATEETRIIQRLQRCHGMQKNSLI